MLGFSKGFWVNWHVMLPILHKWLQEAKILIKFVKIIINNLRNVLWLVMEMEGSMHDVDISGAETPTLLGNFAWMRNEQTKILFIFSKSCGVNNSTCEVDISGTGSSMDTNSYNSVYKINKTCFQQSASHAERVIEEQRPRPPQPTQHNHHDQTYSEATVHFPPIDNVGDAEPCCPWLEKRGFVSQWRFWGGWGGSWVLNASLHKGL